MTNRFRSPSNLSVFPPDLIWLEPEQIAQAKGMSEMASTEAQRWQFYLNALGRLGFAQWLNQRMPDCKMAQLPQSIESGCYVKVNGFIICLIAVEHVLDEIVKIPQIAVDQPHLAAHFYVLQEVSEEQELVTIRGFCRYDELLDYCHQFNSQIQDENYYLPLTFLDAELSHLVIYCHSLDPAAIALPTPIAALNPTTIEDRIGADLSQRLTRLTEWLQDTFDQGWQAIDQLIDPGVHLALSTRGRESVVRRGKLINLGAQLGQQTVALLVNVTSEAEGKIGVLVQLHPTGDTRYMMANLKLSLRSQTGEILQTVTTRSQDNYIQLKPFKGLPGTRFSVAMQLDQDIVAETFEL